MSKMTIFSKVVRTVTLGFMAFAVTLSVMAVNPQTANADQCSVNGRDCYFGYFFNGYDGGAAANGTRWNVLSAPALLNVSNVDQLVGTIWGHLGGCPGGNLPNQNGQNPTGAAFIVLTQLGAAPGTNKNVACQRFAEWENAVRNYDSSGLVNYSQIYDFGGINTRSTLSDVAYYPMNGSADSIVFYHPTTGQPIYAIKKDCANPVGRVQALVIDYSLEASIQAKKTDGSSISGNVEPGESVRFEYNVRNTGGSDSLSANCDARTIIKPGYASTPSPPESGGTVVPTSCPRTFPSGGGITTVATRTLVAGANTTLCATLFVSPSQFTGGTSSREVCVPVVSKPYLKVFGGDVRTGGGVETAADVCTADNNAGISAWNRNTPGYYGAGTQYAQYVTGATMGFGSSQNTAPGTPTGLSFASTTQNLASGKYGGNFGTAKCIPDYFSQKPATTSPLADLATVNKGAFSAGNTTLPATTLTAGKNWVIYIDGDLQVNGDITYGGSWTYQDMPMLQVVVRGNIYIAPGVQNLSGTFIAQPRTNGTGGIIYTCASSMTIPTITNGVFATNCGNRLTINGSFVAKDIEFLRVRGTLNQSAAGETNAATSAAEVFNYGPAFWISQPYIRSTNGGEIDKYDAITSLPPVL
jgi:hypothetical protein